MRVLLAEDDARLAAVLAQGLAEAGWEVEVVGDGRAAYARALSEPSPDVLLLDWMLPGWTGSPCVAGSATSASPRRCSC